MRKILSLLDTYHWKTNTISALEKYLEWYTLYDFVISQALEGSIDKKREENTSKIPSKHMLAEFVITYKFMC